MAGARIAQYEHTCDQCGETIRAYRNCEGEAHATCAIPMDNKMIFGLLKLTKVYDYEEVKKANIIAKFE